jgi:hypothetical protein
MFEYQVLELNVPTEFLALSQDPEIRKQIRPIIEAALNEQAKNGWRLHMSGLMSMPTLILEREVKAKRKTK